ncbi:MAG: HAD family hydrolase [Vicinamibacterales bacterium]
MTRAVLFDVDFTLIYPGPMFQGEGYKTFCARYGIDVDASLFDQARAAASTALDATAATSVYDNDVYVDFTRRIIEGMGGRGEAMTDCAREIYAEWAACHHFILYDEVPDALRALVADGVRVGLVSNSHRCLSTFQTHFGLDGLIDATISSSEHGLMKPHPSIFAEVLRRLDVPAADAVMVGDSVSHDVEGGLCAGTSAVLLHRDDNPHPLEQTLLERGVPTIRTLHELPAALRSLQPAMSAR